MKIEVISAYNIYVSKSSMLDRSVHYPNIVEILNSIIDWENSDFPKNIDLMSNSKEPQLVEDRTILGDNPQLKDGVTFSYKNQLFYVVDKDKLALINSETGILGLVRIISDYILPEYKIRKNINYLDTLVQYNEELMEISKSTCDQWLSLSIYQSQIIENCDFIENKRFDEEPNFRLPYSLLEFMKTEFPELNEKQMAVTIFSSEVDIFGVTLEIQTDGKVYYDEYEFADENHAKSEILSLLAKKMN